MRGNRPAKLLLPAERVATSGGRRRRAVRPDEDDLDEGARAIFEALRAHRLEVAQREGVAAYLVGRVDTPLLLVRRRTARTHRVKPAHREEARLPSQATT